MGGSETVWRPAHWFSKKKKKEHFHPARRRIPSRSKQNKRKQNFTRVYRGPGFLEQMRWLRHQGIEEGHWKNLCKVDKLYRNSVMTKCSSLGHWSLYVETFVHWCLFFQCKVMLIVNEQPAFSYLSLSSQSEVVPMRTLQNNPHITWSSLMSQWHLISTHYPLPMPSSPWSSVQKHTCCCTHVCAVS